MRPDERNTSAGERRNRGSSGELSGLNRHLLKSSFAVSLATLSSRLLGLVRVMLESRTLGGGEFAGAWFLAFSIPNLFRRLLGEGALGTALIPLVTQRTRQYGDGKVREDLGVIFAALGLLLALIVILVSAAAWGLVRLGNAWGIAFLTTPRMTLTLRLLPLLMPYAFFICLIGVIGAVLNTRRSFFLPAVGALSLNVFLIGGLSCGYFMLKNHSVSMERLLEILSVLVLFSGLTQLVFVTVLLWKKGVMPSPSAAAFRDRKILRDLWQLVLPGMIGGAALQVSFLVDRLLAISIGPRAVPALSNTDRVIDLPIGIFAISLGAVLMAELSRLAAKQDYEKMAGQMIFSLRQVYFICIPMAVFVIAFRDNIFGILLRGGNFTAEDLKATTWAALFYSAGIPVFCAGKVIMPMFFARKQMTTPLRVSLICIAVNIALNLILMHPMQQGGIALATVVSAFLNNFILMAILSRQGFDIQLPRLAKTSLRALAAAVPAGIVAVLLLPRSAVFDVSSRTESVLMLFAGGAVFGAGYLLLTFLMRSPELSELTGVFLRRRRAASTPPGEEG